MSPAMDGLRGTQPLPRRMFKLGGSLLDLPDLGARMRRLLVREPAAENLVVVGGGRLADVIRDAHAVHRLTDETSHWLCIRLMAVQAELLHALLPEATIVTSLRDHWPQPHPPRLSILEPWSVLLDESTHRGRAALPASWDVTSDSIAAHLALVTGCAELVLLKSCAPPEPGSLEAAIAGSYVDGYFRHALSPALHVRAIDLRDPAAPHCVLQHGAVAARRG